MTRSVEVSALKRFYQDRGDFYDADTGECIASYPSCVQHDYDARGAQDACAMFMAHHPDYLPEEP